MIFNINSEEIKELGININEFLALVFIHSCNSGNPLDYTDYYQDYESLSNKKLIKILKIQDETKYVIRHQAKVLVEKALNGSINITGSAEPRNLEIDEEVKVFRRLFKGLKPGAMGSKGNCTKKLIRWLNQNPEYSMEDVIKATKLYIASLKGDYRYLQQADYFISKKHGKDDETSRLSAFIEEIGDDMPPEEGWTNKLK